MKKQIKHYIIKAGAYTGAVFVAIYRTYKHKPSFVGQEENPVDAVEEQENSESQNGNPNAALLPEINIESSSQGIAGEDNYTYPRRRECKFPTEYQSRKWMLRCNIALVFIGAFYSCYSYQQWKTMNGQLDVMKDQLEAARNDSRPWVLALSLTANKPLAVGEEPSIGINIINSGKTPAIVHIYNGWYIRIGGELPDAKVTHTLHEENFDVVMPPGGQGPVNLTGHEDTPGKVAVISQQQMDAINSGAASFYVTGSIIYRDDIHGDKKSVVHTTVFCFKFSKDLKSWYIFGPNSFD